MGRDIAAQTDVDFICHLHIKVKVEALVHPVINGVRDDFLDFGIGQDFEIDPFELLHRKFMVDVAVKQRFDISLLGFGNTGDINVLEQ